jgi:ATP synthase protein I
MTTPEKPDEDFSRRLEEARAAREPKSRGPSRMAGGGAMMGPGMKAGIDFAAAIAVSSFIGWALDRWLGTKPWMMILFFFLGAGSGVMSVYRAMQATKKQ